MFSSISIYYPLRLHVVVRSLSILLSLLLTLMTTKQMMIMLTMMNLKYMTYIIKINKMMEETIEYTPISLCSKKKLRFTIQLLSFLVCNPYRSFFDAFYSHFYFMVGIYPKRHFDDVDRIVSPFYGGK